MKQRGTLLLPRGARSPDGAIVRLDAKEMRRFRKQSDVFVRQHGRVIGFLRPESLRLTRKGLHGDIVWIERPR